MRSPTRPSGGTPIRGRATTPCCSVGGRDADRRRRVAGVAQSARDGARRQVTGRGRIHVGDRSAVDVWGARAGSRAVARRGAAESGSEPEASVPGGVGEQPVPGRADLHGDAVVQEVSLAAVHDGGGDGCGAAGGDQRAAVGTINSRARPRTMSRSSPRACFVRVRLRSVGSIAWSRRAAADADGYESVDF
jgi:hypothetical protein